MKTIAKNCLAMGAYGVGAALGMGLVFGIFYLIKDGLEKKEAKKA